MTSFPTTIAGLTNGQQATYRRLLRRLLAKTRAEPHPHPLLRRQERAQRPRLRAAAHRQGHRNGRRLARQSRRSARQPRRARRGDHARRVRTVPHGQRPDGRERSGADGGERAHRRARALVQLRGRVPRRHHDGRARGHHPGVPRRLRDRLVGSAHARVGRGAPVRRVARRRAQRQKCAADISCRTA